MRREDVVISGLLKMSSRSKCRALKIEIEFLVLLSLQHRLSFADVARSFGISTEGCVMSLAVVLIKGNLPMILLAVKCQPSHLNQLHEAIAAPKQLIVI
jgi:hypothetical protein